MLILGVDIGTTSIKMGVFRLVDGPISLVQQFTQGYDVHIYEGGQFGDIEQAKWKEAFVAGCEALDALAGQVELIALSGTTPGLTAMDGDGEALYPAILMLDQRSREQARHIIDTIGLETLLEETGNMPVAGGCSLASILWIKDTLPHVFDKTYVFGHSNTYVGRWLTGTCAIDPSSASLTALYNTTRNDLTWNRQIAEAFGLSCSRLPRIVRAYDTIGPVRESLAKQLGLSKQPDVLIGGNDAVLAAYSVGVSEPGQTINVNGTCEIALVCLSRCLHSVHYNVRAHVIPDRWLTLHVMNAGGKAIEWYHQTFCSEMSPEVFHREFLPETIETWLDRDIAVTYVPYLMGSRYNLEPLQAELKGLTHQTSREEVLAAIIQGLCAYQRDHLVEIHRSIPIDSLIHVTGGAVSPAMIEAKKRWMWPGRYVVEEQSSMKGAAMLAKLYLDNL